MKGNAHRKKHLTSFQIISGSFALVILTGAFLLMLPSSSKTGTFTPFHEALFTSTSAVCVTGLVVRDTASSWSYFGQLIILLLIQIGGLGVITVGASFALISRRKISLMQRSTMQEAIAATKLGGVVNLTQFILKATFSAELLGALCLIPIFVPEFGARGVWMSIFHSISAFCNAGFDLMGTNAKPFVSLTSYYWHPGLVIIIMLLIITGGIGFLTWQDIIIHRLQFRHYRMQTKVILCMTTLLIAVPAILFYNVDYTNLPGKERLLCSLFQAVTPRTAGFNTTDYNAMTGASRAVTIILMLIGGSPGSTAGGMKTTTIAVLLANAISIFLRKEDPQLFHRRIDGQAVRDASTIMLLYVSLFTGGAIAISLLEGLPMDACLFETASAVGTVGLTLGITPTLGVASQFILIILMFLGRVGGLTLIYAAFSNIQKNLSKAPVEKIIVG